MFKTREISRANSIPLLPPRAPPINSISPVRPASRRVVLIILAMLYPLDFQSIFGERIIVIRRYILIVLE
jgi:hypothetical protein